MSVFASLKTQRHFSEAFLAARSLLKKPRSCLEVFPTENLQNKISHVSPGSAICLKKGVYKGSLVIRRSLTLWGEEGTRLRSSGTGTNLRILAPKTQILGLTLEGSGKRYDLMDAALYVGADHVKVEGVAVLDAMFGIVVEKANHVQILNNFISGGQANSSLGLRGDAIRFWEMRHSLIQKNEILNSRDVVVWYSYKNKISNNKVKNGRYGTHFMYSHNNEVSNNQYIENVVGIFIMYSKNNLFKKNVLQGSSGAAGYGVGIKESGDLSFLGNRFLSNTVGVYLDTAPYDPREKNMFKKNLIQANSIGILFHSSPRWNIFHENSFRNNLQLIQVNGGGVATNVEWAQNYFDDYRGYDMDGDGFGDIPHEFRRLSGDLVNKHPVLAFFRGTLSFFFVDLVGQMIPLFVPELLLKDETPSMRGMKR